MAVRSPVTLYASANIAVTKSQIVAAAALKKRIIRKATFCNDTGGAVVVDLYIDPTGSAECHILDTKTLADKEIFSVPDIEGHVLGPSGTMDLNSDTANVQLIITASEVID